MPVNMEYSIQRFGDASQHVYGCCCRASYSEQSRYVRRWLAPAQRA